MISVRTRWLVLVGIGLAGATRLSAQGPPGLPEAVLFGKIPAVTGASRFEQGADEAPASVTIIAADEIARHGWRTLAEVLQSVRGVYTSYDRNYTFLGVRGFLADGPNSRVLILLDGQRMNTNVFGSVHASTESSVELDLVERIEVIRGPGSTLYGTGAFIAVINVTTKHGRAFRGGEVATAVASFGGRTARVSAGTRFRSGVEVLASGSLYRSAGQDLYFPEFDDPATNDGRAVNRDRDQRAHASLKLTRGSLTLMSSYVRRQKQIPTASYETIFDDPAERTTDRSLVVALQFAPTVGRRGQLQTALSYNLNDYDGVYPYPGQLITDFGHGRWWIGEGSYSVRIGGAHQLVVGAEYQQNARQAQGVTDSTTGTVFFRDDTRAANWGIFAQDEIRLSPRVLANAGLRYDRYPGFGGTVNPRLALIYHHAASAVKLLAGRAFRAPSSYERFYTDVITQKTNPTLNPEDVWTVEGVVERQVARRWRVSVSGYRNQFRRLINLVIDSSDSLLVYRNAGSVDSRGVEIETEGDLDGLNLRASYGIQVTHDRATGAERTNSPRHVAKLSGSRNFLRERMTLGAEIHALSRRTAGNGGRVPGYAVANPRVRTQGWLKGLSAGASVYNVFNAAYGDPGSEEHLQTSIPQDRRSFRASVQYAF